MYNYMLDLQKKRYEAGEKHLSAFSMMKLITPLKKQEGYEWLCEVSTDTLKKSCQDLSRAYENFFSKRTKFPRFKSRKRSRTSYPVRETVYFIDGKTQIEKIGKVVPPR